MLTTDVNGRNYGYFKANYLLLVKLKTAELGKLAESQKGQS